MSAINFDIFLFNLTKPLKMEQKLLVIVAVLLMLIAPTEQAQVAHDISATVVGNVLSAQMLLVPLALLMLIIAVMM